MRITKAYMRDFALEKHFARWEFTVRHHLAASDVETLSVADLLHLAGRDLRDFAQLRLGYTETRGDEQLRIGIAATYERLWPDHIQCFAGAEEGIYVAMRTLLAPGDHAITLTPNYQSAETLPLSICEVTGVALRPECDWQLDVDDVRKAIRPTTRLVAINFPHNPTGAIARRRVFDELVALCRHHGLWLFSDEVYRGIEAKPEWRLPQVADVYERGLSLNVMSKAYGLPGLRIGWIACRDTAVLARFNGYKHYLSICNAGPSEFLALLALQHGDALLERAREICAGNRALLGRFFGEFPDLFEGYTPMGGCVLYPRYKGAEGVEALCSRLAEENGIFLLPASVYESELGETPGDRFRIGYGRRSFAEGLDALRHALA
jgi:aspartate/methionine/tyrosine aminotransferase